MSNCALNATPNSDGSCLSDKHIHMLEEYATDVGEIIQKCSDDQCVLDKVDAPEKVKEIVKREALKVDTGAINHNYWLNNTEIDNVMSQFRIHHKGFAHGFIHMCDLEAFEPANIHAFNYPVYSVHDIDFANEFRHSLTIQKKIDKPDTSFVSKLSTYDNAPLTSFGIICNTDSSKGSGQHWFAIFISTDMVDATNTSKPYIRIELFNSAGGGCSYKAFNQFWQKQAMDIADATGLKCSFDSITNIQHQRNNTGNCGSYSLFYIYSRLNGALPSDFDDPNKPITDELMLKFRSVCFKKSDDLFTLH